MNFEALAKAGYEAHYAVAKQAGYVLRPWDALAVPERMAWIAAAQEICDIFAKAVTA